MKYGINIIELEERLRASIAKYQLPYDANWIMEEVKKLYYDNGSDCPDGLRRIGPLDGNAFYVMAERINGQLLIRSARFLDGPSVFKGQAIPL